MLSAARALHTGLTLLSEAGGPVTRFVPLPRFLAPALVLVSNFVGPTPLTLVFPPLLVASLAISVIVVVTVIYDGEYTWIEGVALIGLYVMLAAGFWWG